MEQSSDSSLRLWWWLFPVTYVAHIAEEYWGSFQINHVLAPTTGISATRFLVLQTLGVVLMVLGILISQRLHFAHQMLIILTAIVLGNSLIHFIRSLLLRTYDPGLFTALLLWLPLGSITLILLRGRVRWNRYVMGISIGLTVCGAVELISRLSSR
jgi:hypothetical protein